LFFKATQEVQYKVLEFAASSTSKKQNGALLDGLAATLDHQLAKLAEIPRQTQPIFILPDGSTRQIQAEGLILSKASRRPHPYNGNSEEPLAITSSSHIKTTPKHVKQNGIPSFSHQFCPA
jgi:hypothetical protein